jgi:hypothetical protein
LKKIIVSIIMIVALLMGCVPKSSEGGSRAGDLNNIDIEGVIRSIEVVDGNLASILISDSRETLYVFRINAGTVMEDEKDLVPRAKVKIEYDGTLAESYPYQGNAIKVDVVGQEDMKEINRNKYSAIPVSGPYDDNLFVEVQNKLGFYYKVIYTEEKFTEALDKYGFSIDDETISLTQYDEAFFEAYNFILLLTYTSSTPQYSVTGLSRDERTLDIDIEQRTSEIQTEDILLKGFLVQVEVEAMRDAVDFNINLTRKITTK